MPPKAASTSSGPAPTRSSTRIKTPVVQPSATEPAPARTTRSTRIASTNISATASTSTKRPTGTLPNEIGPKNLRPLADRGTNNSQTPPPEDTSGAAMLAATKRALRPVTAGVKPEDREQIKAYLRIRPDLSGEGSSSTPYLDLTSETEAQMTPPSSLVAGVSNIRIPNPSSRTQTFQFTKVFPPETSQPDLFATTTLPIVKDVLNGENGLLFAYGVTNSGKTYTIQGKSGTEQAGILPRTIDAVFNSIEGLQGSSSSDAEPEALKAEEADPLIKELLSDVPDISSDVKDTTVVPVDPKYEYRVFISYAEVYNNQIYDLLNTSSLATPSASPSKRSSNLPSSLSGHAATRGSFLGTSFSTLNPFAWMGSSASRPNLTRGNTLGHGHSNSLSITTLTRRALSLKKDHSRPEGGKYVANLSEIRVYNGDEARKVVQMGAVNRRVFGTVANKESSRSHAVFTLRVERVMKDIKTDIETYDSSRLSIVDLAGSERNKNTQATGDRMDEANKINSSLMVLGQCMRILRNNQKKLMKNNSLRPVRTEIPPYRMSKLTELFQEFFEGRGKVAMIVNVNPYDTGYHENSAVMEFSALASEISTVSTKPLQPALTRKVAPPAAPEPVELEKPATKPPTTRQVRLSIAGTAGAAPVDRLFEVVEEAEEPPILEEGEESDEEEEDDTLISRLFEELETMRERWMDAEIRCAVVEAETRESVMQEMEERMKLMERMHTQRMREEMEANELKMDLKIEMLSRAGALGSDGEEETEDEIEESFVEKSLIFDREPTASPSPPEVKRGGPRFMLSVGSTSAATPPRGGPSTKPKSKASPAKDEPVDLVLPDAPPLDVDESDEEEEAEEDDDEEEEDDEDEDEWRPASPSRKAKGKGKRHATETSDPEESDSGTKKARLSGKGKPARGKKVDHDQDVMSSRSASGASASSAIPAPGPHGVTFLSIDDSLDEPAIVPNRKAQKASVRHSEQLEPSENGEVYVRSYVPDVGEPGTVKKKKRVLGGGKNKVLTEDDILEVAAKVDSTSSAKTGSIRRLDRRSK